MKTRQTPMTLMAGLVLAFAWAAAAGQAKEQAEVSSAVEQAKIVLTKAIEITLQEFPDGKLLEAELEMEKGKPIYEIELLIGNKVMEVEVCAISGEIVETETEKKSNDKKAKIRKALDQAQITMTQAIEIALKKVAGGKAFEAELEMDDGQVTYEVEIVVSGKVWEVEIDAATSEVLSQGEDIAAMIWDFDSHIGEEVLKGWLMVQTNPANVPARWQVMADVTSSDRRTVLALTETRNYGHTYNLAISEDTSFTDLDITVDVKAVSGSEDQGGGLVWRYQDQKNYYVCRYNPLEKNYRVYHVKDGMRHELASVDVDTQTGKWYKVRATMVGNKINCFLDGKLMLKVQDETFKAAGKVGLWAKADAVTSFDDLWVTKIEVKK